MNIFALKQNPKKAPIDMIDKHIVKMPTETCQMLHTNSLYFDYIDEYGVEPTLKDLKRFHAESNSKLMKPAMLNHPSTIWARQSIHNSKWLYEHGLALCEEYTYRYDKIHGSESRIKDIKDYYIDIGDSSKATPVTIAMFDRYRTNEEIYFTKNPEASQWDFVIESYRNYYLKAKWSFANWKKRDSPDWWANDHISKMREQQLEIERRLRK